MSFETNDKNNGVVLFIDISAGIKKGKGQINF